MATELQLFEDFTIYDFVLPLILQNKSAIAEKYLEKAINLQQPLLSLLDSLLDQNDYESILEKLQAHIL